MNRRCSGPQPIRVPKPVTHEIPRRSLKYAQMARVLAPPPDAKRPSRVTPCRRSVLRCPTPKLVPGRKNVVVSKSGGNGTRSCASPRPTHWQRGQRNQQRNRAAWKVGRSAPGAKSCEDTRSTTELSNRFWDVPQIWKGARAPFGRRRRCPGYVFERLLCPGSSASPWFAASCCRDGLLAVIQPLWLQKTSKFPSMLEGVATTHNCEHWTSNARTSLGRCSNSPFSIISIWQRSSSFCW